MKHLDLFSGIGGFAYAAQQVWGDEHEIVTFCEIDKFCQKILKKHWPETEIIDDIRKITADTECLRKLQSQGSEQKQRQRTCYGIDLLTGGFPCQPFSCAGKRKGKDDDRHLWPEMLRVIQLTKPTRIIAENVRGILTIDNGMVFEQVCLDLEGEGYEVQTFIIPACAVNAPHRRDRVWILANSQETKFKQPGNSWAGRERFTDRNLDASNAGIPRRAYRLSGQEQEKGTRKCRDSYSQPDWWQNWLEVATSLCRVDDGISNRVDRLKSLGNAIVPQVAMVIMQAIKDFNKYFY